MRVSFCLPHPVAVSDFMICRGLCACTEMLWMGVLYVSFGSKVRPRTFMCLSMGSALMCIITKSPRREHITLVLRKLTLAQNSG